MQKIYDIWFSSLDLRNNTKLDLLNKYTSQEIYNMELKGFIENEINEEDILKIINSRNLDEAKKHYDYMIQKHIKLISIKDEWYPEKLNNINDKPAFLYVRGNEKILDEDSVRNCWLQNGK